MGDGQFSRIERLVGPEGLRRLHASTVMVIGLGAVGGYAVEALARAGVGKLQLIDFDVLRESNLNRQLYATHATLGRPKADVARERVLDIHPACTVEAQQLFVHRENLGSLLASPPDLLIDAIDSVGPKIELLAGAVQRGIPLIASMGAALRTDPTAVRVGPLAKVIHCPLARRIRKELKRRQIRMDFPCVYSIEPLTDLPDGAICQEREAGEDSYQRGRTRSTIGSLPTLTGIFGLTVANCALKMLLGDLFPGQKV